MAIVNKRKVLSVEGKSDTTNRKWKKESRRVSGIWSRKFYDQRDLGKRNQIICALHGTDGDFEHLNDEPSK